MLAQRAIQRKAQPHVVALQERARVDGRQFQPQHFAVGKDVFVAGNQRGCYGEHQRGGGKQGDAKRAVHGVLSGVAARFIAHAVPATSASKLNCAARVSRETS